MPQACDLLVTDAYLITLDEQRRIFARGALAIDKGQILAVGREQDIAPAFAPKRTIDADGGPVLPGAYDCHAHVGLHTTRGAFSELGDESDYFTNYIAWTNALDSDDEYASTLLACLEMLKNGVTCFVEPGTAWDPAAVAAAVEAIGMRGSVADAYIWDVEDFWYAANLTRAPSNPARAERELGKQLHRNTKGDSLVGGHVALYGIGSATDELMLTAKGLADEHQTFFTMHQSFEPPDIASDDARFGKHPLVHFAEIGALGKSCLFAHMNAVRDDEVSAIVESGMSIAWNPGNYMYWSVGDHYRGRMAELHRKGANISFGTDIGKVWGAGEQSLLGYLVTREKSDYLAPEHILEIHALNGARAMQRSDLGSLAPGKRADLVIHTTHVPEQHPALNVVRNLALVSRTKSTRTVIVEGRVVLEDGRPTQIDEEHVYATVRASVKRMVNRVGLQPGSAWPTIV
jgi:cytosine/adenosine deaminase-related metal-dependent hydrolase